MKSLIIEKDKIRLEIRRLKKKIAQIDKEKEADNVFERIELMTEFKLAKTILMYWSTSDELPTHKYVQKWSENKVILLPSVVHDVINIKKYTNSENLKLGNFGIWEPAIDENYLEKIDLVIIPGIAFDQNKNRLGRGKGYYDRFLHQVKALKWGVGFNFQILDEIPVDKLDISMDKVFCSSMLIE